MQNSFPIKRSQDSLRIKVISLACVALGVSVISTFIIAFLFRVVDNSGIALIAFIWIIMAGSWGLGSLKLWGDWLTEYYELTPDSIIIHKKDNEEGLSQSIYRYESVISLRLIQSKWGTKHNYGDVYLAIPKIDKELVLKDIENPLDQLALLKKQIDTRPGNHNLIT